LVFSSIGDLPPYLHLPRGRQADLSATQRDGTRPSNLLTCGAPFSNAFLPPGRTPRGRATWTPGQPAAGAANPRQVGGVANAGGRGELWERRRGNTHPPSWRNTGAAQQAPGSHSSVLLHQLFSAVTYTTGDQNYLPPSTSRLCAKGPQHLPRCLYLIHPTYLPPRAPRSENMPTTARHYTTT